MKRNIWQLLVGASLLTVSLFPQMGKALGESQWVARRMTVWQNGSFPVENFQGYTSPFGYRRSPTGGYSTEFHSGLDFAAPTGSYIRSWWSGRVIKVADNNACGTSVRVQSGSWTHVYCHLKGYVRQGPRGRYIVDRGSGIQIRQGQTVRVGQRLGRVGMTGRTTGPHLHWTLKYQGKYVDPAAVLRAMYTAQRNNRLVSN